MKSRKPPRESRHICASSKTPNPADEAKRLVYGDRNRDYGTPLSDFSKTALIWTAILGTPVTAEQVAMCMVGVKLSRQVHRPKSDNIVDGIGYLLTLHEVIEERKRRGNSELQEK